jgi:hypothetical protein
MVGKTVMCKGGNKNDKVILWNIAFGVGNYRSYSSNGRGKHRYWNFSAATHRI